MLITRNGGVKGMQSQIFPSIFFLRCRYTSLFYFIVTMLLSLLLSSSPISKEQWGHGDAVALSRCGGGGGGADGLGGRGGGGHEQCPRHLPSTGSKTQQKAVRARAGVSGEKVTLRITRKNNWSVKERKEGDFTFSYSFLIYSTFYLINDWLTDLLSYWLTLSTLLSFTNSFIQGNIGSR